MTCTDVKYQKLNVLPCERQDIEVDENTDFDLDEASASPSYERLAQTYADACGADGAPTDDNPPKREAAGRDAMRTASAVEAV